MLVGISTFVIIIKGRKRISYCSLLILYKDWDLLSSQLHLRWFSQNTKKIENPSTQTYYDLHRGVSRLSNNQLLKFPVVLVIHIHWKMPLIPRALSLLMPVFYTRGLPGGAVGKEYTYCYARCPNPPAGKEKTSMTMQHAKEGKFIADSSQGPCCNQRIGTKSESPEPQFPRTFIGCSISNISSG